MSNADAEIQLYEDVCELLPSLLDKPDAAIAEGVERELGIPAAEILKQFRRPDAAQHTTAELVMLAHDPHFWGGL